MINKKCAWVEDEQYNLCNDFDACTSNLKLKKIDSNSHKNEETDNLSQINILLNNQSSEKEYFNRKREDSSKKCKSAVNNSKLSKNKIGKSIVK